MGSFVLVVMEFWDRGLSGGLIVKLVRLFVMGQIQVIVLFKGTDGCLISFSMGKFLVFFWLELVWFLLLFCLFFCFGGCLKRGNRSNLILFLLILEKYRQRFHDQRWFERFKLEYFKMGELKSLTKTNSRELK
mmetsp:Transcript_32784/g.45025  ORF Transcript_32784/g.45025 Transcript_32784/m.45025 type:complete len:133 (+) Transcript_32784:1982-2380(+)